MLWLRIKKIWTGLKSSTCGLGRRRCSNGQRRSTRDRSLVGTLAENDQYLRICGEGYRAVSLNDDTPLSGYGKNQCRKLSTAEGFFSKRTNKPSAPRRYVPERQLQCWLIREALQKDRSLKKALKKSLCGLDDILFALDEVSLGGGKSAKRLDMLCVGCKADQWHPLVIELKYDRKGPDLEKQVTEYANELEKHRANLDPLLEEITGKDVHGSEIVKMVIFPAPKTSKPHKTVSNTNKSYKDANILLVEFKISYSFFKPVN